MIYFLIVLYALLICGAAFAGRRNLGHALTAANLLGSIALLCTPLHLLILPLGLIVVLVCAIRNGYVLQGYIRPLHVLVRCVISLCLYLGYIFL